MGHLDCFQLLAITRKVAINKMEHVSLWNDRASFGYMSNSVTAGASGRSTSNFLRKLQIDILSHFTSLKSHHQWRNVPFSPHTYQQVLLPEFFILVILIDLMWNLRIVLSCIFLITKDFEHLSASEPFKIPLL